MAGSVGWTTIQGKGQATRNQLMEFSMTPMGLDPDALPAIGRMTESLRHGMTRALSAVDEEAISMEEALQAIREEITAGLQEVLDEFIQEDERQETPEIEELDEERGIETDERDLEDEEEEGEEPDETRIDNEPEFVEDEPMFWDGEQMLTGREVAETTSSTVRVVVENEGEDDLLQRAGAALSKKNRDDLEAARKLIAQVIDRATPDDDEILLSLEEEDERTTEPAEAADDGTGSEEILAERDEDEGVAPNIVQEIEELLAA